MAIICPHCGTATSFNPVIIEDDKAFLTDESSDKRSIYGKARVFAITDDKYPHDAMYGILECASCGKRFVAIKPTYKAEWAVVYPILHKHVAEEIPEPIRSEFQEAYLCFAVGAYKGCLLVCRTVLIAVQRERGVTNLKELREKGLISDSLYRQADEVRLWANMFGHEDVPVDIAAEDCEQLLAYIEALLNAVYVEPKRLSNLAQKRGQIKSTPKTTAT